MILKVIAKSGLVSLATLVLVGVLPASVVLAEETTDSPPPAESATQAAPEQSSEETRGPDEPQGPDANTYTYNPDTGKWENEHYIWDPVTKQTQPKNPQTYSYNPDSQRWDTTEWRYNPASGKYEPNIVSVRAEDLPDEQRPGSSGQFDLFYDASISNNIQMDAASGNALVSNNTLGGNALSGNASSILNLLNMLQTSAAALQGNNLAVFSHDVYGDVQGDLMINPNVLLTSNTNSSPPDNLTINVQDSGSINNDITLASRSGDAAVTTNTAAGNATTGNAAAVANIVNIINSIIGSGQSFLGSVNIHGSLDGDILLPPELLEVLLASSGASSNLNSAYDSLANINNNQSINNNVNLTASSGNALVSNNTRAGNATTGGSQTNLTILNLAGTQIVGKDVLLVFINVMGNWVGVLYSAPPGSTAAAIGSGITQNSTNSNSIDVEATTNQTINNDIDLTAVTGDASVANNTTAGNATSGDALAAANILNILNSTFSLADWFGILFINVFGSWNGSFGIDTAAGNRPETAVFGISSNQNRAFAPPVSDVRVFRFVPSGGSSQDNNQFELAGADAAASSGSSFSGGDILGGLPQFSTAGRASNLSNSNFNLLFPVLGGIIGFGLLGAEKLVKRREELSSLRELSRIVFRGKL